MISTEELLKKCKNNDPTGWNEFFKRFRPLVAKCVWFKLKKSRIPFTGGEHKDLVQEIFFSIWEKGYLSNVSIKNFKNWLIIVSLNTVQSYCRKKHAQKALYTISSDDYLYSEDYNHALSTMFYSSKQNIPNILDKKDFKERLKKEISKLPDKQQLALKFNIYEDKKQKEIANIMNIPLGTVSILIYRAKNTIIKNLKKIVNMKNF
ncbi:MAG: sigma-70 family RNA polymerase sigma factor [Candidatus Omnitrophota bacterium]